jgi:GntP family gluconate:H+ symporter
VKRFGKKGTPYAFSVTLSTITLSLHFDALLVLVAPIARIRVRRRGHHRTLMTPFIAAAQAAGCKTASGTDMVEAVEELMADFMLSR